MDLNVSRFHTFLSSVLLHCTSFAVMLPKFVLPFSVAYPIVVLCCKAIIIKCSAFHFRPLNRESGLVKSVTKYKIKALSGD